MDIFVSLWGLLLGLIVGFTSIGTGIIGSPGLILFFGMDPLVAVGTIILTAIPMMITSVIRHMRQGNVQWTLALLFSLTAFPSAYLTARKAAVINEVLPLKYIIGIIILVSVPLLLYRYLQKGEGQDFFVMTPLKMFLAPFFGILLGAVMGATGITGSLTIITFLLVFKMPSPLAVGTTSVVGLFSLMIAGSAHFSSGNFDQRVLISLIPGVIIGAFAGTHLVHRVPRKILQIAVLAVVTAAGILIIL